MARSSGSLLLVVALLVVAGGVYAWRAGLIDVEGSAAPPPSPASSGRFVVHYVDVGQGDATVWQLPGGAFVVYDCGPPASSEAENRVVAKLRELGATRIHALIASHGHLDHVGGCEEVLAAFAVDHLYEAWYSGADRPASYQRFKDQLQAEGGALHTLASMTAGDALDAPGVTARLVAPAALDATRWDDIAEDSLVVRVEHGASSFCFQGDIEEAQERALAAEPGDLSCDVYLVGHHGSRHASTDAWLRKMRPKEAVVSFGENSFGHPTSEALCRIQHAGARVFATHRAGSVVAESDGEAVTMRGTPETRDYCAVAADYWAP